ncbi:MAG TPA: 5-(carboxyamino)imidazole ribonucleotide synthase [Longimicrobium sp.]|jgi:5-(carboxyamino)imidazole ribonucleotide synthase|uniref:5-(carboxyamino)imidazole ribonucleotide synthase n=1 Tax=Longimicrobium sp. TaxID=2029185 RepID=UPI002EDA5781
MTARDAQAPFLPGATIGMVGGGQLGRMFALEARRMGYRLIVLDPGEDTPAAQFCDGHIRAPFEDLDACLELARRSDLVTLEWENADVATLREMERIVPVRPGPAVLEVAQHRVREKETARSLGVLTADFRPVRTRADLDEALREVGTPAILKTARMGYDGKGQATIRTAAEADAAWEAVAAQGDEFILEARVPFQMEVSVVCARSVNGETACFPVAENEHRNGILHLTRCPARIPAGAAEQALSVARTLAEGLGVIGLLAVEMFVDPQGRILMNEIAPRPHNSGHHTLEACGVSQFEQQLRAVCGLPLGSPALLRPAAMVNLMGEDAGTGLDRPGVVDALAVPETALHLYGKGSARPGRKMGHLTSLADDADTAAERAMRAWTAMAGGG